MKLPIHVQQILHHAPHRPPMSWVDEILSCGATAGECQVRVRRDAHYMGPEGLRPSSLIEFIAQAYGFMNIAHELLTYGADAKPLKRAFLAAVNDASWAAPSTLADVRDGDVLNVKITGVRRIGPIASLSGQVLRGSRSHGEAEISGAAELLGQAKMKIYSER